jgi:putative NADH-flavin reductase
MTKIAIVGATGPTGIHLAAELCRHTAAVRVIARDMDKLARLFPDAAVEKRPADILDADATLRAIEGCDLVYDCVHLSEWDEHDPKRTGAVVYLYVSDADAVRAEWASCGVEGRLGEARNTDYGMREFGFVDTDGTLHRVGSTLP